MKSVIRIFVGGRWEFRLVPRVFFTKSPLCNGIDFRITFAWFWIHCSILPSYVEAAQELLGRKTPFSIVFWNRKFIFIQCFK